MALLIYFGVKEMPRGKAEPEFENMSEMATFRFSWAEAKEIFKKRTMWFVFLQGFAGVFPWNVIMFFFFGYLETERGYDSQRDHWHDGACYSHSGGRLFRRWDPWGLPFQTHKKGTYSHLQCGRFLGALFIYLAMTTPLDQPNQFFIFMCLTAIFMPLSSANVIATVYDVTVPKSVPPRRQSNILSRTAARLQPLRLTGAIIVASGDKTFAILSICVTAWLLCFFFYLGALFTIDKDTNALRAQMAERAKAM